MRDGGRIQAVVTTRRTSNPDDDGRAQDVARRAGLPYISRDGASLLDVLQRAETLGLGANAVLVAGRSPMRLHLSSGVFYYHPGMGVNRLRQIRKGRSDWMVKAMDLHEGDRVLDATLGLASDLLVASHVVGDSGRAVGLESQPLLALMVREGLETYTHAVDAVTDALRRIEVVNVTYQSYLGRLAAGSFDVIYFDPMFDDPVAASRHMIPIRLLANQASLDWDSLNRAAGVAVRRVVVKDRSDGPYVRSGWFEQVVGGPKSRIAYCILRTGG